MLFSISSLFAHRIKNKKKQTTVAQTKEKTVIIKVDDNTKIEFTRSAISSVILQKEEKADKKDKNAEEKAVEDKTEEK